MSHPKCRPWQRQDALRSATGCFCAHIGFLLEGELLRSGLLSLMQAATPGTPHPTRGFCPAVSWSHLPAPSIPLTLMRSHCGCGASIYRALGQRAGSKSRHCFQRHECRQAPEERMGSGDGGASQSSPGTASAASIAASPPDRSAPHLLGKQPPLTTCPLAPPAEDTPRSNC